MFDFSTEEVLLDRLLRRRFHVSPKGAFLLVISDRMIFMVFRSWLHFNCFIPFLPYLSYSTLLPQGKFFQGGKS